MSPAAGAVHTAGRGGDTVLIYSSIILLSSPVLRRAGAEPAECFHSAGGRAVVHAGRSHNGAAGALHAAGCGGAVVRGGFPPIAGTGMGHCITGVHKHWEDPHVAGIVRSTGLFVGGCTGSAGNPGPSRHPVMQPISHVPAADDPVGVLSRLTSLHHLWLHAGGGR